VVGAGVWGQAILRTLREVPQFHVVGVVDPDIHARNRVQTWAPDSQLFPDLFQVPSTSFDVALIASPTRHHASQASWVLKQGLDIFVEKPLAASLAEAQSLVQVQQQFPGAIAMVGFLLLYHPAVLRILEMIRSQSLGTPRWLVSERHATRRPSAYSALWELAAHDFSLIQAIDPSPLREMSCTVHAFHHGGEDAETHVELRLSSQFRALLSLANAVPHKRRRIVLATDHALVEFDDLQPEHKLRVLHFSQSKHPPAPDAWSTVEQLLSDATLETVPNLAPLQIELEHLAMCLLHRKQPLSSWQHGVDVVRWLEQASQLAYVPSLRNTLVRVEL
jgi:predicted dehydrogenase